MRPSSRRIRWAATLGATLLFATTLTSAPTEAQTATPNFEVRDSGYGWLSMMGHGWDTSSVQINVYDDAGAEASTFGADVDSNSGFSAHLEIEGLGPDWSITVVADDGAGNSKTLIIPDLALGRVDTSTREVSGTSENGLSFSAEACRDSSTGHICESVPVLNGDGNPEWTSPALPVVQDRVLGARWTDIDGDAFVAGYMWPGISYRRTTTPMDSHHGIDLYRFPPDTDVAITIDGPLEDFDQAFDVRTNENGDVYVDLADLGVMPSPIDDPTVVGPGWAFTARLSTPDWTLEKTLSGVDLTIDAVNYPAGTATGTCGALPNQLSVNLVFGTGHHDPDQEEFEPPCSGGTWIQSWTPDPARVPIVGAATPESDDDGFNNEWPRNSLTLSDDGFNPLSLGFHRWDMDEETLVTIADENAEVWSGVVNGLVTGQPGEPDRWDLSLDRVVDPAMVTDGWTFTAESTTQMKSVVSETVHIDRDPDGTVAVNEHGELTGSVAPSDDDSPRELYLYIDGGEFQLWSELDGTWSFQEDFEGREDVQVWVLDNDGDSNGIEAPLTVGGHFDNRIQANITADYLRGEGFTPGNTVTVTLTDVGDPSDPDDDVDVFETVADVWDQDGDGQFSVDGREHGLDVTPGLRVTATENEDPGRVRVLDIVDVRLEAFDAGAATVGGWAPDRPYDSGEIRLHLTDWDGRQVSNTGEPIKVYPNGDDWTYFLDPEDYGTINGLTEAGVEVPDAPDGGPDDSVSDGTFAELPFVRVAYERGEVHSDTMDGFETLTVEVSDPSGAVRWEDTQPVGEAGEVGVGGGPIDPGDTVVATATGEGGSLTLVKHHVVEPLVVTDMIPDPDDGRVDISGTATPGSRVQVDVGNEFGGAGETVEADLTDGSWSAVFTQDDGLGEVTEEMHYQAWVVDPDLDRTTVEPEEPTEPPAITAELVNDVIVAERWPDPDALTVTLDGVVLTEFEIGDNDEVAFPVEGDLVGGQRIVATDGEFTKEHVVVPLVITEINGARVSGTADPNIWVGVFNEFELDGEQHGAFRGTITDPLDGTYSVDFSIPPIDDGESELDQVVLGFLGSFAPDDDGDGTFTFVTEPQLSVSAIDRPLPTDAPLEVEVDLQSAPPGATAEIHWGDGTTTTTVLNPDAFYRSAHLAATHSYTDRGDYVIAVDALDRGGTAIATAETGPLLVYPAVVDTSLTFIGVDAVIYAEQTVNGSITINNGTLTVRGAVGGNIKAGGDGGVVVEGGVVEGNVTERGDGGVTGIGGIVYGNTKESGPGDVRLEGTVVDGNIFERQAGDVLVLAASVVDGNVCERGAGQIVVDPDSTVGGNLAC